jgi:uncharacterized membrane protein
MKRTDIERLYEAQLISADQRQKIIEHFSLDKSRNWFLTIMLAVGGVLALMGVILVVSANWNKIPGGLKIVVGAALMAGAHWAGWHWRGTRQTSPRLGEAFHFLGAGLFLANIALVGQVYHLASRTPNAFILWLVGIIPLAWLLRARSIHLLSLVGVLFWFGMEINCSDGWLHFSTNQYQAAMFGGFGLLFYGIGQFLRRSAFPEFSSSTQRLGLIVLHLSLWGSVCGWDWYRSENSIPALLWTCGLALPGLVLAGWQLAREPGELGEWWKGWLGVLCGWGVVLAVWMLLPRYTVWEAGYGRPITLYQLVASAALLGGCLAQIRVAIGLRANWMVNLAIVSIGFVIIADFVLLIGDMMNTGLLFLTGGAGLLALGYVLERNRRAALRQIN